MRTNTNRILTAALALTLASTLAACGADDGEGAGVSADSTSPGQTTSAAATSDDADDTSDDADDTSDDADDTSDDATGGGAAGDPTAAALAAIATAESETGGTAYEVDDQDDDGTWEVDVRVEDRSVEVTVSADGSTVESTEDDDLDDDDRAALDAATITLADAITTATEEVSGVLDDAELEEEDGSYFWEVTVDGTDQGDDDVDVRVDVTDGQVVSVD